ncbi:unnamed protein product [[Candida] boidinii]|uniref:Glutaredoxin-like protein n=1 Tax=Candida boidinii TaxID=5477 RepID=A0A9W6T119_CANBO|nr:hypothetical protein B5S30_g5129 [[Candida] boidinii]GME72538.1 unnamed protein product [[Candida] boidinii]GMF99068.1 unnamed protein product [[Candida] boidinii]
MISQLKRINGSRKIFKNSNLRFFSISNSNLNNNKDLINISFFTKDNCQLCHEGKEVLKNVLNSNSLSDVKDNIDLKFIDITKNGNESWFNQYRYDIPVIHIDRSNVKTVKFMHRFDKDELIEELTEDI